MPNNNSLLNVRDVMSILGVSQSYAYQIIKTLNDELKKNGFMTIPGKVPCRYLEQRYFGF